MGKLTLKSGAIGIKVFSCVIIIIAFLLLFLFLIDYIREVVRRYSEFPNYSILKDGHMISVFHLSYFLPFILLVISGFGMYSLKKWARTLYLVLITLMGLGYILFAVIALHSNMTALAIPSFVIIFSFCFLSRPKILEQFYRKDIRL